LKKSLTASLSYRLQQEHVHVVVRVSCGSLCSEEHDKIRSQVGYERTPGLLVSLKVRVKQEWMVPFSYNLSKSIISYIYILWISALIPSKTIYLSLLFITHFDITFLKISSFFMLNQNISLFKDLNSFCIWYSSSFSI